MPRPVLRTHILNVGHGDTIIIESPDSKTIGVVDCFNLPKVSKYIFETIDPEVVHFVLASHPHEDHIKTILPFIKSCEERGVLIKMFLESGYINPIDAYTELKNYLEENRYLVLNIRAGSNFPFPGGVTFHVIAPPAEFIRKTPSDCNNSSVVLLILYGSSRILLAGDAEFPSWAHSYVDQSKWLQAQVMKISHHGSKHGTFFPLIATVNPRITIISDPLNQKFPHPHVKDILKAMPNLRIYQTSKHGHIVIDSYNNKMHKVKTQNSPE